MWRQKGQDMIEYALMLALVVGIGGFIYTQGYGDNISAVFNNAGSLLEQVNKSQEEAKEEAEKAAARNDDRNYADHMAELLKDAIKNGGLVMDDKTTVYLLAQNKPGTKLDNSFVNGAVYGQTKEALIKSLSAFILEFLCTASSWDSLNSSLFASSHSLHCTKIRE